MQTAQLFSLLNGFHTARVIVLGDVMLDRFIYGSVERISPEAPIPVVNVERTIDMPGGAANVARNIAALGARATLIGVVGEDDWAEDLRIQISASPTIEAHLIADLSRPTTVKTRYVADGQQVMRADRESRAPLSADVQQQVLDVFEAALPDAQVIVLSDYAKGVLSDALTRESIELARAARKIIVVDPKSKNFARYRGATMLTPNRLELQQATGQDCSNDADVVTGARRILEQRICDWLVVTRGKDGMSVIGASASATGGAGPAAELAVHLPTAARQVYDVSGAGDTVVAAIALGLAAGAEVVEAAELANSAAGIVVGKRGTATVTTGELIAALTPSDGRTDPQKIFSLESVLQLSRGWREQGLKIAFTNGCFDLLHPGHISLLEYARRNADRLIVGLNADLSIRRLKGPNRPVQGEVARATVLAAVKSVDAVVIFEEDTPIRLIETLEPDVLVKGADYTVATVVGADLVRQRGGKVILAPLLTGHSTTETVNRAATQSGA
ncbi:MAG TPA: D-glycero-beta-D-manno-heptose-7-phosphate kinase [Steroidobacteraceae bacterium]|nr:D-glycero-beta-D-manno-heptose-7-phosphate kinase [Steroidobacteraceae bacterium]